ncbi:cytochrome c oxidase assembly protein [Hwanghaeella grinnelliae]|uniref:cytochrome c oxidase assembly protein n=1 Tax=Hwanghaeella grinnelliae TaxID=2500179 RepID=UPI001EFFB2D9|nr:cytochrome c oxidase assembly protein [Hwanghaeella grinnelliae]
MSRNVDSRNKKTMLAIAGVVCGMVGLAYASVPLYEIFCRVTGYGGTTQVAEQGAGKILDREMAVRFDATTSPNLPWTFEPEQREVTLRIGEDAIAYYRATNNSDKTITGTATFNVTPLKAGLYFTKIDCFCFTEQTLKPGETVDMPVVYYVDPELDEDPNLDEVRTLTLSYTFFPAETADRDNDNGSLASLK